MRRTIFTALISLAATASLGTTALATDFEVKPGNIQFVGFESDAPIETINGISTQAKGKLSVNLKAPSKTRGTVSISVASISTGNKVRDGHLQGKMWLDAKAHPNITFEIVSLSFNTSAALADGVKLKGKVTGKLTIKGKTKKITAPIRVGYLKSNAALKKAHIQGNAVRIRAKFDVTLADFGIKAPDHLGPKLAKTVQVRVKLTGEDK